MTVGSVRCNALASILPVCSHSRRCCGVGFLLPHSVDNHGNRPTSKIGALLQKTVETKQLQLLGAVTETHGPLEGDVILHHRTKLTGKSWDWPENLQSRSAVGTEQRSDDLGCVPGAQIHSQILKRIRGNQPAVGEPVEKTIDWPNPLHDRVRRGKARPVAEPLFQDRPRDTLLGRVIHSRTVETLPAWAGMSAH